MRHVSVGCKGWIYVTSHHGVRRGDGKATYSIYVVRSRDGGKTFDEGVNNFPNNLSNSAEMPAVLTDGTLIASFVDVDGPAPAGQQSERFDRRRAWVLRSTDGGTTFSTPLFVNDACGPPPGFQLSALTADRSDGPFRDRLYFACRQHGGGPIVVNASADRGDTWSKPAVVGSAPVDAAARRIPGIAVNNLGVLGVAWIERRMRSGDRCQEVQFSASLEGGTTFLTPQRVSTSSCGDSPADAIALRRWPTNGDYFGLATMADGRFRILWPEMRGGASVLLTTSLEVEGQAKAPAPKP